MARDFDLDVQVLKTEATNDDDTRILSKSFCTPGCNPTATLCTSCIFVCV
ncbi:MAG: gallidermin/nisin family lantibiotic [Mediterraneibacter gnavus]|jgi:gallidermin/nisin family lantibiotic